MTKLIEHSRRHGPFDLRRIAVRERLALRAAQRRGTEAVAPCKDDRESSMKQI